MQKKNDTYKGHWPWQSEFDHQLVYVNHNAWSKVKKFNKKIAKRREKRSVKETVKEEMENEE